MSIEPFGKAYKFKTATNDDVVIGDSADAEFHPKITLNRCDGECFLKLAYDDSKIAKPQKSVKLESGRVQWETPDIDFHFYPLLTDEGGLEFEIILKQKPAANTFSFPIETQSLKFYYQPVLTPEEIADGCVRPENVVGSYAVYHATKTSMHRSKEDAEKYKCGKAFHIYRPKLTDALGKTAWADLNIDEAKNLMIITLPQAFLDSAAYPVVIDPEFGYTTMGANTLYPNKDLIIGSLFTTPTMGGILSSIFVGLGAGEVVSANVKCAMYLHSDLSLTASTEQLNCALTTTKQWFGAFNFGVKTEFETNTDYLLMAFIDYTTTTLAVAYDIGDANQGHTQYVTYDGFPNPLEPSHDTKLISIYCVYTLPANLPMFTSWGALRQQGPSECRRMPIFDPSFSFKTDRYRNFKSPTPPANLPIPTKSEIPTQTYTKSFSFDVLLQKQQTKPFSFDGLLQKTITKTVSFDGLLAYQGITPFSFDGLLQKTLTKSISFDGLLQKTITKTYSFDGLLTAAFPKDFSFDSLLQKEQAKAFAFDGLLQKTITKEFSFDGLLLQSITAAFTFDGLLSKTIAASLTFDALLLKELTKLFSFDGLLQKTAIKDFSFDALLSSGFTADFSFDSLLQKTFAKDFSYDALLQKTLAKDFSFDALLQKALAKGFSFDAILEILGLGDDSARYYYFKLPPPKRDIRALLIHVQSLLKTLKGE